jgi:uncharacterized protein
VTQAPWRATLDGVIVACRLTPKGGRDSIDGVATLSDGMRVLLARVRSAPEDGEANAALCRLIAEELGVAASKARVVFGAKSRVKQVAVTGEPAEMLARLERATLRWRENEAGPLASPKVSDGRTSTRQR